MKRRGFLAALAGLAGLAATPLCARGEAEEGVPKPGDGPCPLFIESQAGKPGMSTTSPGTMLQVVGDLSHPKLSAASVHRSHFHT